MARPLKPLVKSGGYYPSKRWTPLVYPGGYTTANGGGQPEPEAVLKTVTGSLIHITDALARPAEALSVNVEPIQDLHGYDSPWPAGGGENKVLLDTDQATVYGLTIACANESITLTGTANNPGYGYIALKNPVTLPAGEYKYGINLSKRTNLIGFAIASASSLISPLVVSNSGFTTNTITLAEETTITRFRVGVETGLTADEVFSIFIGSTSATAWSPYSNICPISGRTSATVMRTGINVWDEEWEIGSLNVNTGGNAVSSSNIRSKNYINVIQNYTYRWKANINNVVCFYDVNKHFVTTQYYSADTTFTVPTNVYYIRFYVGASYGTTYKHDISINYPSTDHAYHSGQVAQYTIDLGGTVYGGQLDVTGGKMVVDRAITDLGTLVWTTYSSPDRHVFRAAYPSPRPYVGDPALPPHAICSSYYPMAYNQISASDNGAFSFGGERVVVIDHRFSDATSFGSAVNGVQLCYELANPFEITLTPTQIEMLLGENNLWADAGDSTLTYYAEGEASTSEALGILLGGTYNNPGGADDASDDEALGILLGGS
jgi:hypothetical protein